MRLASTTRRVSRASCRALRRALASVGVERLARARELTDDDPVVRRMRRCGACWFVLAAACARAPEDPTGDGTSSDTVDGSTTADATTPSDGDDDDDGVDDDGDDDDDDDDGSSGD